MNKQIKKIRIKRANIHELNQGFQKNKEGINI